MTRYKKGDRVNYRGMKFTVVYSSLNNFKQELLQLERKGIFIKGFIESHQVKPIIRVYGY